MIHSNHKMCLLNCLKFDCVNILLIFHHLHWSACARPLTHTYIQFPFECSILYGAFVGHICYINTYLYLLLHAVSTFCWWFSVTFVRHLPEHSKELYCLTCALQHLYPTTHTRMHAHTHMYTCHGSSWLAKFSRVGDIAVALPPLKCTKQQPIV